MPRKKKLPPPPPPPTTPPPSAPVPLEPDYPSAFGAVRCRFYHHAGLDEFHDIESLASLAMRACTLAPHWTRFSVLLRNAGSWASVATMRLVGLATTDDVLKAAAPVWDAIDASRLLPA